MNEVFMIKFFLKSKESSFKEKISRIEHYGKEVYFEIEGFSEAMKRKMGLSNQDVKKAYYQNFEWVIPGYIIYPAYRSHNGWKLLLEVRTSDMSKSHGYRNVKSKLPPDNWHYKPSGTRTEILPDSNTQLTILELIKEWA